MMGKVLAVCWAVFLASLIACSQPSASESRLSKEIEFLIHEVEKSSCRFLRNGKSYSAHEAANHMRMKYDYAGSKIHDITSFIEKVATKSSLTGRPYFIECDGRPREPSAVWLKSRLAD